MSILLSRLEQLEAKVVKVDQLEAKVAKVEEDHVRVTNMENYRCYQSLTSTFRLKKNRCIHHMYSVKSGGYLYFDPESGQSAKLNPNPQHTGCLERSNSRLGDSSFLLTALFKVASLLNPKKRCWCYYHFLTQLSILSILSLSSLPLFLCPHHTLPFLVPFSDPPVYFLSLSHSSFHGPFLWSTFLFLSLSHSSFYGSFLYPTFLFFVTFALFLSCPFL